jgi:hypothetical protein
MVSRATGKLADSLDNAADALRCLLCSDDKIVVRAAAEIMASYVKLRDAGDVLKRLEALEERLAALGKTPAIVGVGSNGQHQEQDQSGGEDLGRH